MKIKLITYLAVAYTVAVATCSTSCSSIPKVTVIGQFGTYCYSSKGGLVLTPKYPVTIHPYK